MLTLKCSCCAAVGAAALGMAQPAVSLTIIDESNKSLTYLFDQSLFEGGPGSVNDPSLTKLDNYWLKAVFKEVGQDKLRLYLTANLVENSGAFISSVAFNLLDDIALSSVQCLSGAACAEPAFNLNYNGVNMANNIQGLDLQLLFPMANNPGTNRFGGTDSVSFTIKGTGLTFLSFNALNEPPPGGVDGIYAAARLQGYGEGSSTVFAEVPGPVPLLGAMAAFQASRRLRRRLATGDASAQPKG